MRRLRVTVGRVLAALAIGAIVASCGGTTGTASAGAASPAGVATTPPVGGLATIDCGLLAPADFAANGVDGAGTPTDNPDGTSHYCVYAGSSGATGGIEFDVFPHEDVASAEATYATATGEGP